MSKAKPVNYELIDRASNPEVYFLISDAVEKWHPHLSPAKILAAWRIGWAPDKDDKLILGQCKKASDLSKELLEHDFVILLNREYWESFSEKQQIALIDHELSHAAVSKEDGTTKRDERGRIVYRTRRHDIEEFSAVVRRHGLYKSDLEAFAKAIQDSKEADLFKRNPKASGDIDMTLTVAGKSVTMTDREFSQKVKAMKK